MRVIIIEILLLSDMQGFYLTNLLKCISTKLFMKNVLDCSSSLGSLSLLFSYHLLIERLNENIIKTFDIFLGNDYLQKFGCKIQYE